MALSFQEETYRVDFSPDKFKGSVTNLLKKSEECAQICKETWNKVKLHSDYVLSSLCLNQPNDLIKSNFCDLFPEKKKNDLVKFVGNAKIESVVLEAGHVYAFEELDQELSEMLMEQFLVAKMLSDKMKKIGIAISNVLFIDDYNTSMKNNNCSTNQLNMEQYVGLANKSGFQPDLIIFESNMEELARVLVSYLEEKGLAKGVEENDRQKFLTYRNVELIKENNMVSCVMLDTALSILKLSFLGDGIINILPDKGIQGFSYKNQQKKLRQVLSELFLQRILPIFNTFTSSKTSFKEGANHYFRKSRIKMN